MPLVRALGGFVPVAVAACVGATGVGVVAARVSVCGTGARVRRRGRVRGASVAGRGIAGHRRAIGIRGRRRINGERGSCRRLRLRIWLPRGRRRGRRRPRGRRRRRSGGRPRCRGQMGALDDARTAVMGRGLCRRRGWERDDHRSVRRRLAIGLLGGQILAEWVWRRKQEREKPSLPARSPSRRRPEGSAVLNAQDRAAQRDRDVAVLATAHTWEQRQSRQGQADPQHARERRRRGQARRLESRQEPRSHRGLCGGLPPIRHVCQPQYSNRRYLSLNHRRCSALRASPIRGSRVTQVREGPTPQTGCARSA